MKKNILVGAIAGVMTFCVNAAEPTTGTLSFNGTVVESPCNISSLSADQAIDLGLVSKSILNQGGTSSQKDINIVLENCDVSTMSKAKIVFSGNVDGSTELATSGTAKNVVVKINGYGKNVEFGQKTDAIAIVNGTNTLHFTAWAEKSANAKGADVTEGNFSAVSNFNISYE